MTAISIKLPNEVMTKLKILADVRTTTPEELVRASIESMVEDEDQKFKRATDLCLRKKSRALIRV